MPANILLFVAILVTAAAHCVSAEEGEAVQPLRVLFVGDSISNSSAEAFVGYAHPIAETHPHWEVARLGVNTSANLLARLTNDPGLFRGYDVVYVNSGLHSIRQDRFEELATYEENLARAAKLLSGIEDTTVIWRTTTPIAERASGGRDGSLVAIYNEVSVRVMRERGIPVDDVYAFLLPYLEADGSRGGEYLAPDGTHWRTRAQAEIIAPHVVDFISKAVRKGKTQ